MAYGDLGAVVDTLTYHGFRSLCNEVVHVVDDIFAVSFREGMDQNYVRTFSIDSLGQVSDAYIDSILHDVNVSSDNNRLAKLTDSLYAIATNNQLYQPKITTIEILPNGQITDTVLDTCAFDLVTGFPAKLQKCGPGMLAMTSVGWSEEQGWLHTIKVYPDGSIEPAIVDALQFETGSCYEPWLEEIHPGTWAIAYQREHIYGQVKTFSISAAGIIYPSQLDSLEFEPGGMMYPSMAKAHGDFVAIGYSMVPNGGKLSIVEIGQGGAITDTVIDSYLFDPGESGRINTYHIAAGYIGVAYTNAAAHGVLKTFFVDENGSLNDTTIDTLEYDTAESQYQHVVHVTGDVWAVTYFTTGPSGKVASFGLETPPEPRGPKDLMRGIYS
ncbi:hypothetical protein ES703_120572 [subsurface metagenome]